MWFKSSMLRNSIHRKYTCHIKISRSPVAPRYHPSRIKRLMLKTRMRKLEISIKCIWILNKNEYPKADSQVSRADTILVFFQRISGKKKKNKQIIGNLCLNYDPTYIDNLICIRWHRSLWHCGTVCCVHETLLTRWVVVWVVNWRRRRSSSISVFYPPNSSNSWDR